jgi:hypothetical protein
VTKVLPSGAILRKMVGTYTEDSRKIVERCLGVTAVSDGFREIYQISLSTYAVLEGLAGSNLRPSLSSARSIAVRIPLLVSVGQSSAADAELRRFTELALWTVYFTDHPIEWRAFNQKTGGGFSQDARRPISYSAYRQLRFYLEYAFELMEQEPSGLGAKALNGVDQALSRLNAAVHAGRLARATNRIPPHDDVTEPALRSFARLHRLTFSNCILLLAAYRRARFDHLNAVARAHFDWLIGPNLKREVRKGPFGLP